MTVVAIDHGEKRIGLAVSGPDGRTALALPLYQVAGDGRDVERLAGLLREREPARIVIGLPLNMDGTEGPAAERVRAFAAELQDFLLVPIEFWDERLTSEEAGRRLRGVPMPRSKKRGHTNTVAAQVILESYLDAKRGKA